MGRTAEEIADGGSTLLFCREFLGGVASADMLSNVCGSNPAACGPVPFCVPSGQGLHWLPCRACAALFPLGSIRVPDRMPPSVEAPSRRSGFQASGAGHWLMRQKHGFALTAWYRETVDYSFRGLVPAHLRPGNGHPPSARFFSRFRTVNKIQSMSLGTPRAFLGPCSSGVPTAAGNG